MFATDHKFEHSLSALSTLYFDYLLTFFFLCFFRPLVISVLTSRVSWQNLLFLVSFERKLQQWEKQRVPRNILRGHILWVRVKWPAIRV